MQFFQEREQARLIHLCRTKECFRRTEIPWCISKKNLLTRKEQKCTKALVNTKPAYKKFSTFEVRATYLQWCCIYELCKRLQNLQREVSVIWELFWKGKKLHDWKDCFPFKNLTDVIQNQPRTRHSQGCLSLRHASFSEPQESITKDVEHFCHHKNSQRKSCESFWYEKTMENRGLKFFLSKLICLTESKRFCKEFFCDCEKSCYNKTLCKTGGITIFCRRFFVSQ